MLRNPCHFNWFSLLVSAVLAASLAACNSASPTLAPVISPQPSDAAAPTASVPPPTPTPPPLAATVDGVWILQADFDAELLRYQDANPDSSVTAEEQRQVVLNSLVDETLLAAAAEQAGQSTLDDAALQARIDALAAEMGGAQALTDWQTRNHYTDESFRRALRRQVLAAWQRDQISAGVPQTAEQVHARQILLRDLPIAQNLHNQLVGGADFATLALQYDAVTGGELGWFPRGYLTQPAVEEVAFGLQPEQFSDVIESPIGYHIVYVVERDPQHALSPEALRALQSRALNDWLDQRRAQSQITLLSP